MAKTALDSLAQLLAELTLCKSRIDEADIQWYTGTPFWRRDNMRFSRDYRQINDYEIGSLKHGKTLEDILDESNYLTEYLLLYKKTARPEEMRRIDFLIDHTKHLNARTRLLLGEKTPFDRMTDELYCLVAPAYDHKRFDDILAELDQALPGHGPVGERVRLFRDRITVPPDKLLTVLEGTTEAFHNISVEKMKLTGNTRVRIRTRELPSENEAFISVLFGYDYHHIDYERGFNLRYKWTADKVVECIGHEMAPGHLTYFEKRLQAMIDNSWPEMSVLSQFSSSFSLSEGASRYAVSMCFGHSRDKLLDFEREEIFRPAGIDMGLIELMPLWHRYCEIAGYGKLEATRNVWDGVWSEDEAARFLERYAFTDKPVPASSLASDEGHFVSHDYSRDVVRDYFADSGMSLDEQWAAYERLCGGHVSMRDMRDRIPF